MEMRRHVVLALTALSIAACGGSDKPAGPSGSIAGTYTLQTINGAALPVTVAQSALGKLEITGGSATLHEDNSFSETFELRGTPTGGQPETESSTCPGTYTRNGNSITFTEPDSEENEDCGGTYAGTLSGANTLTLSFGGITAVLRK